MSSFYPGHNGLPGLPSITQLDNCACNRFDVARDAGQVGGHDDSDLETEAEWFDEPSTDAPPAKNPSKKSNVMAVEVWILF